MENRILSRSRIWSQSQPTPPAPEPGQAETTTVTVSAPVPEPSNEGMPKGGGRVNIRKRRGRLI